MKKLRNLACPISALIIIIPVVLVFAVGCKTRFLNSAFRSEQIAVDAAYTSYQAWTNYLSMQSVNPQIVTNSNKLTRFLEQSNEVKQARIKFGETVYRVEQLRSEAETNSAAMPTLRNTLKTLSDQSDNIVFTINLYRSTTP